MKNSLLIIALVISISLPAQDILSGKATNVYDGDTFTLQVENGRPIKIRVVGIDAPEKEQDFGIEARDFARSLIDGKDVTVYLEPGETYGRSLGIVITEDGKHFNYEMVAKGFAWYYDYYTDDKFLEAAFENAKDKKIGLWDQNKPVAPWVWRKQNRN